MLKLEYDGREVNVRFSHSFTGLCRVVGAKFPELDYERRCTWVQVIFPNDNTVFNGEAICHPKDNYCKSTGRKLALANAMKDFGRNLRRAVWQEYFEHCK